MVEDIRLRMLDDLLSAERRFRELAERRARALTAVLTELAYRLDGERLEKERQTEPGAPWNWDPEDWQRFFLAIHQKPQDGWGNGHGGNGRYKQEIASLQVKVEALEREVAYWRVQAQAQAQPQPQLTQSPPEPAPSNRLVEFQMPKVPLAYAHRWLVRGQMSKADAELHLRRRGMALKCLADGLNVQIEIGKYIGDATGAQYRSGSIRRVFEALESSGLIVRQTLTMHVTGNTPSRLALARLSAEGKRFCQALGWQVVESEWERLIRLHEGDAQEEHTMAVLLFASAARLRGWTVAVLPDDVDHHSARPDLAIAKGEERLYVEVEIGTRLHDANAKWRMNADLNGGRVVLVARNVEDRQTLIADCRHIADHGLATDIETLIASKFVESDPPLWAEEW